MSVGRKSWECVGGIWEYEGEIWECPRREIRSMGKVRAIMRVMCDIVDVSRECGGIEQIEQGAYSLYNIVALCVHTTNNTVYLHMDPFDQDQVAHKQHRNENKGNSARVALLGQAPAFRDMLFHFLH